MKLLKVYNLPCWLRDNALYLVIFEGYICRENLIKSSLWADLNNFLEALSLNTIANTQGGDFQSHICLLELVAKVLTYGLHLLVIFWALAISYKVRICIRNSSSYDVVSHILESWYEIRTSSSEKFALIVKVAL